MITERDVYANMRRLNRLQFQDKNALEQYQREKLQHYLQHQLSHCNYYKPWLGKDINLIPLMDSRGIAQHFSSLCSIPSLDYHSLFAEGMRIHARGGNWRHDAPYYTLMQSVRHRGWELQVYDEAEQIRKMAHFLSVLTRNAGSMAVRIAHFFFFSHIMHRLPKLEQSDYRLYDLFRGYDSLCQQLQEQQPDILIAPHGALLQLAYDKLKGKLHIAPTQVYCENAMLSTRDRLILRKAFGQVSELYSHGGRLLAYACEKGKLHLAESQYFFELHWIDSNRFVPIYTDFNAHTLPIFRFQSDSIFTTDHNPCRCGSAQLSLKRREMLVDDVFWLSSNRGSYLPIFASHLEDFAASCTPWDKEYRIVQESLNQITFYSEGDPQAFINREKALLKILHEQGVATATLQLRYEKLDSPNLLTENLNRVQRRRFGLPTQCYFF